MNRETMASVLGQYYKLIETAEDRLRNYLGLGRTCSFDVTSFCIYKDDITIYYEEYCCGYTEHDDITLPIEFLTAENEDEILEAVAKYERKQAEEAEKKRLAEEALKRERELRELKRLAEKYGNEMGEVNDN